jgi:hypothetical protein
LLNEAQILIIKQEVEEFRAQYCNSTSSLFIEAEAENIEKKLKRIIQYWENLREPTTEDPKELEILLKIAQYRSVSLSIAIKCSKKFTRNRT